MPIPGLESPSGNSSLTRTNAQERRYAGYFPLLLLVGGVEVSPGDIKLALLCLRAASGLMIRQPLQRIASPLADCAYHVVSAPWRGRFMADQPAGRGAAGRPIAKEAFCYALEQILAASGPEAGLRHLHRDAMSAFSSDHTYAAAIARAAVTIKSKKHSTDLRQLLRQAAHQATSQCDTLRGGFSCDNQSPCGTGSCRFAQGGFVFLDAPSYRGKLHRPANFTGAGTAFSPDDALAQFERQAPFSVPVPVRDHDSGNGADAVAPS